MVNGYRAKPESGEEELHRNTSAVKVIGVCFAIVIWPLLLMRIGDFPLRQGLVLGWLTALLMFAIRVGNSKPVPFVPYWVRISPNWFDILTDYQLIDGPEEWRAICKSVEALPNYNVLRDGILFTVVQQSEDFKNTLIFWNLQRAFRSEFNLLEDMTEIKPEWQTRMGQHLPPRVFMKPFAGQPYIAGYSLGIEVRDWWWEEVKDKCPAPLSVDKDSLTGSVDITLATLPCGEFDIYRNPPERWSTKYISKIEPQIRTRRKELRQKLGWKDQKLAYEPGLGVHPPESMAHQYFNVEHRGV